MNSQQVKDKIKYIIKDKNIDFNIMLKFYVFDRFIVRLSKSQYKDRFIVKGGFLLSNIYGLESRSTIDIDYALKNISLTEENILNIIDVIINIDLNDNIKFTILGISPIRQDCEYGGFRVKLLFCLDNIKEQLIIDIATGDPITPKEITYTYKCMLDNTELNILSYNLETIIAEKIEAIFSKLDMSSRLKDYYDIYLIYTKSWNDINKKHLIKAIQNTFGQRNFNPNFREGLAIIKDSPVLQVRWKAYVRNHSYAKNIEFKDIMLILEKIINIIEPITIQ